ncbi:MAG: GNAT family N-acetyltransferase [Sphaerochaetaceae bacterium]|jgi:ribosomal-protein-alanine N-acetyltransferase
MKTITTERLILRPFNEKDIPALYLFMKDKATNTYLPWFPLNSVQEAKTYYQRISTDENNVRFAICLQEDNIPIGYVKISCQEAHDFGYALRSEFWNRGIATEACTSAIKYAQSLDLPFITATYDRNNSASGHVIRKLGMKYAYSYETLWQPKNKVVTFRLYQLNFTTPSEYIYQGYWDKATVRYIEEGL